MGFILGKIRELRVVFVVVVGLSAGFNCDHFRERITIVPETRISKLFFLDSATIVYVKTTYDARWTDNWRGGVESTSNENVHSTIKTLNFISNKIDTLQVLPELQIPDVYGSPELSFCYPILLVSPVVLKNNECSSYFYNIKTKTSDKYPYRNQLTISDLPDAAYDYHGNILNPTTGKILFSLPDTGMKVYYYSAKNLTAIYYTQVFDSLKQMHGQYMFCKYDMISNSMNAEQINESVYNYPKAVNNSEYLLFQKHSQDTMILEIVNRDSLSVTFEKSRPVLISPGFWGDICDVNISREWLLVCDDTTMAVRNFNGEVIYGPLKL
jgi:hypothetical protein